MSSGSGGPRRMEVAHHLPMAAGWEKENAREMRFLGFRQEWESGPQCWAVGCCERLLESR